MTTHRPGRKSTSSAHRSDRRRLASQSLLKDLGLGGISLCRNRSWSRSDTLSGITVLHRSLMNRWPRPEALRGVANLRLEVLVGPEMLPRDDRLGAKLGLEGGVLAHCFGS